ncbi:MAG: hypothetical protein HUJ59_05050 [Bacilli bacterium]|nr:hypothetical protein [Bacilli bacterium]
MINENDLLEPRKAYETLLKEEHKKIAEKYFDDLVANAKVDEEANRETIELFNKYGKEASDADSVRQKKKKLQKFLVTIGVILIVIGVLVGCIFINYKDGEDWMRPVLGIVAPMLLIASAITVFILNGVKVSPVIKNQDQIISRLLAAQDEQKAIGYQQLQLLNKSYTWNMHVDIVNEALPVIELDKFFDFKRLQYLMDRFDYKNTLTQDMSIVHVQSGEILGNPFVIQTVKIMAMGTHTYEGSLTYRYQVKVPNGGKDGGYHWETRTDTLTAYITKPRPFYNYEKFLYYGTDVAPKLSFSRQPSGINNMDDGQIKKYITSETKKLNKLSENTTTGFTADDNKQFETLFHAWDRNDEVHYRVLFTPLAQKNFLDLIKNKEPYGDDFYLKKDGKLNKVRTEHSQYVDYVCSPYEFQHYSIDDARKQFVNKNMEYFKSFFFDMAPLLSIPIYQQYPTDEYIFKKALPGNNTIFEEEAIANAFPRETFMPNECGTELILKAAYKMSEGQADRVGITSHGYQMIEHLDYVTMLGKDGHNHEVPVNWIEYKKVTAQKEIEVIHHPLTRKEYDEKRKTDSYKRFVNNNVLNGSIVYDKEFFAFLTNSQRSFDKDSFKDLLNKGE